MSNMRLVIPKRVFFSFAGQGADIANRLQEELKDNYDCFIPSKTTQDRLSILQYAKWFLLIITKETLNFPQCIEGCFSSFSFLINLDLRFAKQHNRKILIIKELMYSVDYSLLPNDIADTLSSSNSLVYMSEFFNDCVVKIRTLIGPSDKSVMSCIQSNPSTMSSILLFSDSMENIRCNNLSEFVDILDQYFDYPLHRLRRLSVSCHITATCFDYFRERCPTCELSVTALSLPDRFPKQIPNIKMLGIHLIRGTGVIQWVSEVVKNISILDITGSHVTDEGEKM